MDPDILVEAVARLERVDLHDTSLTTDQLTGIFRLAAEIRSMKLRMINILGNEKIMKVTAGIRREATKNRNVHRIDVSLGRRPW